MRIFILILSAAGLLVLARTTVYTVDKTEYVYLTQFGRHVATFDGNDATDAGLHFKWPWPIQSVQYLDRRLQFFDLPRTEFLTRHPDGMTIEETMTSESYVCWQIASKEGVDRFVRSMGIAERAREVLRDRIVGDFGARIVKMSPADLINDAPPDKNPVNARRKQLRNELLKENGSIAQKEGIEIVDIQIKRLNHPLAVQPDILKRIRSERDTPVAHHDNEGRERASQIVSEATHRANKITTNAKEEKTERIGKAQATADASRNRTHDADPQFYRFLKDLEAYKEMFDDGKTMILLSTHHKFLEGFLQPPRPLSVSPTATERGKSEGATTKPSSAAPVKNGGQ